MRAGPSQSSSNGAVELSLAPSVKARRAGSADGPSFSDDTDASSVHSIRCKSLNPLQWMLVATIGLVSFWRVIAALRGLPPETSSSRTVEALRRIKVPTDVLSAPRWQTLRRGAATIESPLAVNKPAALPSLSQPHGLQTWQVDEKEAEEPVPQQNAAETDAAPAATAASSKAVTTRNTWDSLPAASTVKSKQDRPASAFELGKGADSLVSFTFGSHADLSSHRKSEGGQCWDHFDFGMLERWDDAAQVFCSPPGFTPEEVKAEADRLKEEEWLAAVKTETEERRKKAKSGDRSTAVKPEPLAPPRFTQGRKLLHVLSKRQYSEKSSWLVCRVTVDDHLPPPTAPHTMCDGANIVIDFRSSKLTPTLCPANRPGYKCDGPPHFWHYAAGALTGNCVRSAPFQPSAFPRDHLMDLLGYGWSSASPSAPGVEPTFGGAKSLSSARYTLFVTRERQEHANLFHATTDWMNAFCTLHSVGAIDGLSGSREGMDSVQVVLLDEQTGPFEASIWKEVFSPLYPLMRPSTIRKATFKANEERGPVLFERALFVPPGYTNLLLSSVVAEGDCHGRTQLLQSYRAFFLAGMGFDSLVDAVNALPPTKGATVATDSDPAAWPLRVTVVSRRPYHAAGIDHAAFMGRQLENEDELVQALQAQDKDVVVRKLDFAPLSLKEQVEIIATTDVLVAMHGAALTYAALLPPHAGVLELWPKDKDMWRCFEHLSTMSGVSYSRWENKDPGRFRIDAAGDYTRADTDQVKGLFRDLVAQVRIKIDKTLSGEALYG